MLDICGPFVLPSPNCATGPGWGLRVDYAQFFDPPLLALSLRFGAVVTMILDFTLMTPMMWKCLWIAFLAYWIMIRRLWDVLFSWKLTMDALIFLDCVIGW